VGIGGIRVGGGRVRIGMGRGVFFSQDFVGLRGDRIFHDVNELLAFVKGKSLGCIEGADALPF